MTDAPVPLNTYDRDGVVHSVKIKPTNTYKGTAGCGLAFSWSQYGAWTSTRWTGTHDQITCLSCIARWRNE